MKLDSVPLLQHLYDALRAPIGVVVAADDGDVERLRQRLYALRRNAGDKSLDALAFIVSPTTAGELWIVRKYPHAPQE